MLNVISSRATKTARLTAGLALLLAGSLLAGTAQAADAENPESFKIEITGSAWRLDSHGTIQASGTPINLVSDLGVNQQQPTFFGQLVFKPAYKHRIVVEGTPFRIDGSNTVERSITYHGETFSVNESLRSSANLNYVFGGYQYDLVSGRLGHFGLSAGAAYLGTTGSITSLTTNTTASKSETIGLPLAGAEMRLFPVPGHRLVLVQGDARGMDVGSYGSYLAVSGSGGVSVGPVSFLAGYRSVHLNIHASSNGNVSGVDAHLNGPIFSVQWRR